VTAIDLFCTPLAVHVATDGLTLTEGGDRPLTAPKIHTIPHVPLLIAVRGFGAAAYVYGTMFHHAFDDFDGLVAGVESAFPEMWAGFLRSSRDVGYQARNSQLAFAGWSNARCRCEAYLLRGGEEQENVFPPWKLLPLQGLMYSPPPKEDVPFDPDRVDESMLALMEVQKRDCMGVGGFCQLTTLTQGGITQQILRRWPVDLDRYKQEVGRAFSMPAVFDIAQVGSLDELRALWRAGQITREQAVQAAIARGWAMRGPSASSMVSPKFVAAA
jgi:hypothetical protein